MSASGLAVGVVAIFPGGSCFAYYVDRPGADNAALQADVQAEEARRKAAGLDHRWCYRDLRPQDRLENFDNPLQACGTEQSKGVA